MSDIWSPPGNERLSLRLQQEQMLKSDTTESDCASSPPGSVADSIHGDDLVQSEDDQAEGEALLGNESDGEADEDWAAQMMDMENVVEEDQRPKHRNLSQSLDLQKIRVRWLLVRVKSKRLIAVPFLPVN